MNMPSDTTDTKAPSDTALHPGSMLDSGLRQLGAAKGAKLEGLGNER